MCIVLGTRLSERELIIQVGRSTIPEPGSLCIMTMISMTLDANLMRTATLYRRANLKMQDQAPLSRQQV